MDKAYRRLVEKDVLVGLPIKFSVYENTGTLLLKKGHVVSSEQQRQRLLNKKVYISLVEEKAQASPSRSGSNGRPEKEAPSISVFEWVETHYQLLADVYDNFNDPAAQSRKKIQILADNIYRVFDKNSDGLLAAVQLAEGKRYTTIQALHVGLLCEALGHRAGLTREQRLPLIAAGLTHDIGMWQLQDKIRDYKIPLTDKQWQVIHNHPRRGSEKLQQAGVLDRQWLQIVEQHHERLNGSGYPKKLSQDKVLQSARILAIADMYAAMVRPRGDRDKKMPKEAMRGLFLSRGEEIDTQLAQFFIKELGLFPPGSAVRLSSGETAVVISTGHNASAPEVEVVIDSQGGQLKRSEFRDTEERNYSVVGMVDLPLNDALNKMLSRMWPRMSKRSS